MARRNTPQARARWHHFGLIGSARFALFAVQRTIGSPTASPEAQNIARGIIHGIQLLCESLAASRVTVHDEEYFR